jgi:two-component system nitrogen regulation sensor histidine kinase NtrY
VDWNRSSLTRKNEELEERRRLTETVLETVGTGVLVADSEGTITAINAAAARLLETDASAVGLPIERVLGSTGTRRGPGHGEAPPERPGGPAGARHPDPAPRPVPASRGDRGSAASTPRLAAGAVVVLDDLTPLMRAQKVAAWGEVARKLAHEIKNPLTPIQLSAQRIRKAYVKSAPDFEKILNECSEAIVTEVDALKDLVDEFAQFARLPAATWSRARSTRWWTGRSPSTTGCSPR